MKGSNASMKEMRLKSGFKSVFLLEILSNIGSQDVMIELADPTQSRTVPSGNYRE